MNDNIIKKIKTLPPLPKSVIDIQKITSDPNGSIADLIKVVKEDPMLTANLLKAANSPLYGFSRQIKNVDQAVSLFGMSTVKGFAVASAVRNSMKIDLSAYGISESHFVSITQMQNALIVNWYKRDRSKLDILSTASFLICLLKPYKGELAAFKRLAVSIGSSFTTFIKSAIHPSGSDVIF